jgi:lactate dehydrogenase-like 2-hydroxyacid dehydrogenase
MLVCQSYFQYLNTDYTFIRIELARRLLSFAPGQVLYHKRRRMQVDAEDDLKMAYASLDQIVVESDILCNLL